MMLCTVPPGFGSMIGCLRRTLDVSLDALQTPVGVGYSGALNRRESKPSSGSSHRVPKDDAMFSHINNHWPHVL